MAVERTLSILKPDATRRNLTGRINAVLEAAGLRIVAQKRLHLTTAQAEAFYGVHRERGFFRDLVTFMTSGPVVVQVLEGENAVARNREVMGATNPANAAPGTNSQDRGCDVVSQLFVMPVPSCRGVTRTARAGSPAPAAASICAAGRRGGSA